MYTTVLVSLALLALFLGYSQSILQFMKLQEFAQTIPGPSIYEIVENFNKAQILDWLKELRKKLGPTFRIWLGKDLMVFFADPDDVKCILNNNTLLHKSRNYEFLEPWLGKGLFTNSGDSWHQRRKFLTPAFHFRILSDFKKPMEENCKILVSKLREKADGQPFNIYPYITLFTLDVICETAMGIKKHAQIQSNSEYVTAVQQICSIIHRQIFSFWQRISIIFRFSDAGKKHKAALKILHDETNRVINLRRKMLQDLNIHNMSDAEKSDDLSTKRRLAFLDVLLISQMKDTGLTDREIREEVDTFMAAGYDTTSSAIAFTIYLLSQHSSVQQQAYEEAVAMEGREKETMAYLEAVIKETLRLYPSAPFVSRRVVDDIQIGKIAVPRGASIAMLIYMVHRDETHFPNPEKFDPDRFLKSGEVQHPFSFVAFSAGPRNCIGQKFAMLEMKTTLSFLLRNFELLPVEGFKPNLLAKLVINSGNGIQVRLKPRK